MIPAAGRIRLRPNQHTLVLGAMLITMWYASAAQQNGGAYVLLFMITGLVLVSMLHARANLKAVKLEVGSIAPAQAGGVLRVPLVLSVEGGRVPAGLEITAEGARDPVFIETLSTTESTRAELRVGMPSAGVKRDLHLVVRSLYPLGFFTVERSVRVPQGSVVLPRPAGTLPLPAPVAGGADRGGVQRSVHGAGEGEDFSGLREWSAGDSLRHVDWKAVARGRPMMVKQWSGAPAGTVWLEWEALALPEQARISQLAQWIDEAETTGHRYGLKIPGQTLPPASGPKHRRKCLEALAVAGTGEVEVKRSTTDSNAPPTTRETATDLPGRPLAWIAVALLLAILPVMSSVPVAGTLAVAIGLLLRWRWPRNLPILVKLVPVLVAVSGTWLQLGTLGGLEAGVALLLGTAASKFVEAQSPRDFQLMALLGWFLCLCGLALDQAVGRSLWAYLVFGLIVLVLVRFRRGSSGVSQPLRISGTLLLQATPIVILLFFFFPRGASSLVQRLNRTMMHQTGLSDSLNPGSVAKIAQSQDKAFWVAFEGGNLPSVHSRYWRCVVLTFCNGLSWERGRELGYQRRSPGSVKDRTVQTITLVGHGGTWLPALDRPVTVLDHNHEHNLSLDDDTLRSANSVDSLRKYRLASQSRVKFEDLAPLHRRANLQVAPNLSARTRQLAQQFSQGRDARQTVEAALQYFRDEKFTYTIEPGAYDRRTGLEDFLFDRKQGFCEHFAASFCTLMRAAGVPARVVTGYVGGEYSDRGGYLTLRQADAHAWAEVWIEGLGWDRVDPTAALVPSRMTSDLRTFLEGGPEGLLAQARNTWWGRMIQQSTTLWDHVNYVWYDRVVQFDEQEQTDLWQNWGIFRLSAKVLVIGGMVVFALPLVLLALWLRRRVRHPDPAVRLWQRFCQHLAKLGIERFSSEGALAYAHRAAGALPQRSDSIQHIASLYVAHRYGGDPGALAALREALRGWSFKPKP